MASTIIIKNKNTGAPSTLAAGELAINTEIGSLYYGSTGGTAVSSSFTFSNITSSGTISASGHVYGNNFYANSTFRIKDSGGTSRHVLRGANAGNEIELGNSNFADGIILTGNVTASGTISASGMIQTAGAISSSTGITASNAFFSSNVTASHLSLAGNIHHTGDTNTGITFATDRIDLIAGGTTGISMGASGIVTLVAGGALNIGAHAFTAKQLVANAADGITPMQITSTTLVSNLNADKLDGADLIDEDNMASDSATAVPTQQSVKAYVDANAGGSVSGNTFATDLKIGRDADNLIDFTTDNQVTFRVSANNGIVMKASGEIEATKFDGALEGNADTATALATARDIGGVSFDGTGNINLPGVNTAGNQDTSGTAANATHVAVADNENTNEDNLIPFIEDTSATGNVGLESDGDFHYNPSTGKLTATQLAGTLQTAAQTNITSVGTLSSVTVSGDVNANGNIVGDGATQLSGLTHITAIGNMALGNHATDDHTITGRTEIVGNITASGAISGSGVITGNAGANAGYTVRPNLYFFATNTSALTMNGGSDYGSGVGDNEGSLPATNATTITLTQEQNSHTSVFSLSSNRVTIARAGLYKITYNALLEINNGSNRAEGFVGLVQETEGGDVTLVDGSEGRGYHRFVQSTRPSAQTYAASLIVNVAENNIYDLRFGMTKQTVGTQKLRTMPTGTSFMIEAIT